MSLYDDQLVLVWDEEDGNATVSEPLNRAFYDHHSIQYISDGVEPLKVEISLDKEHWVTLEASLAANTITTYERHIQWVRFTKGATDTVTVLMGATHNLGT